MGVLHQPHAYRKNLKRVTRLVVLPDYQGIGIGKKFLECVAQEYKRQGYGFSITTSAKNLICALSKSDDWMMYRCGFTTPTGAGSSMNGKKSSDRSRAKTAGFEYVGKAPETARDVQQGKQ